MINVKPTPQSEKEWRGIYESFLRILSPRTSELLPVQQAIRAGFEENFELERSGSGPLWARLAASTARERQRLGYGAYHPILVRTGDYRASFVNPGDPDHVSETVRDSTRLRIYEGSQDYRVAWHELGTVNMPARPVLSLSQNAEAGIEQALRQMIDGVLRKR